MTSWRVRFEFKLEDLWVGVFWRWSRSDLLYAWDNVIDVWVCLVPCFPLHVTRRLG